MQAPSETETTVCEILLGDYIIVRLTNLFLVEASTPFVNFIEFFESRKVRCHLLYSKMALLLSTHLDMFLKDGGRNKMSPKQLLKVDVRDQQMQLPKKDIVIGIKARDFIKEIGLNANSPELNEFFESVTRYYQASAKHCIKYFEQPFNTKLLRYLEVLDPNSKNDPIEDLRTKWIYLAKQFPNIVSEEELIQLNITELPKYKQLEDAKDEEVDEWWAEVFEVEVEGEKQFPVLTKLGLGLWTIYNSSSEAERDISKQSLVFADPKKHNTSQTLLQSKLKVMDAESNESSSCARCIANRKERSEKKKRGEKVAKREEIQHCHCSFMVPDAEFIADARNFGPSKRREEHVKKVAEQKRKDKEELEFKKKDEESASKDLKREVIELKKRYVEAAAKAAKEKAANKAKASDPVKVPKKRVAISKEENEKKKRRLAFVFNKNM